MLSLVCAWCCASENVLAKKTHFWWEGEWQEQGLLIASVTAHRCSAGKTALLRRARVCGTAEGRPGGVPASAAFPGETAAASFSWGRSFLPQARLFSAFTRFSSFCFSQEEKISFPAEEVDARSPEVGWQTMHRRADLPAPHFAIASPLPETSVSFPGAVAALPAAGLGGGVSPPAFGAGISVNTNPSFIYLPVDCEAFLCRGLLPSL